MMAIFYTYSTKVNVTYDGIFDVQRTGSLDEIVSDAIAKMHQYEFDTATVTDAETGEVLVIIEDRKE